MNSIRWPWSGRQERKEQREEVIRDVQDARGEVSTARQGLEKVLEELKEKRRGLNA